MSDLKPLRRKIGVLTLVIACMFTGAWVRSLSKWDMLKFATSKEIHDISSHNGRLMWTIYSHHGKVQTRWQTIDARKNRPTDLTRHPDLVSHWTWCGFSYLETRTMFGESWIKLRQVPYWSIAIPLVLLSTWLILGKPRLAIR